jgi:alkylated DNA repair dioxygenase AlkB
MLTACPPSLVAQPSLFGFDEPTFDSTFAAVERHELDHGAWVDHQPGWLSGHQWVFDELLHAVEWQHQQRPMYERIVDVPRLIGSLPAPAEGSKGRGRGATGLIEAMGQALDARYGTELERIGLALYRDGRDSVAWHGDQVARDRHQAVMATVSVGEPRPFRLRPKAGRRASRPVPSFRLGHGDLVVMGGTCQRTWDHAVPKVARAGPRIVIMFRPDWMV